jgi:demethylmenaquinone methyltransferase / 2-methoxy-6-polyprenyl-1,4-benzoquinol methylase
VAAAFSFGQDPRWRRAMVEAVQAGPSDRVLDVATGTGLVARSLVRRYACSVVGLDQSEEMLGRARALVGPGVELVQGEAERLPFADSSFDALTFTYLLRYVDDPAATMRELARVVRPGGRIAMLEFHVPSGVWHAPWVLYTRVGLPALGRLVSREWYDVGRFLGPNISSFWERHPLDSVVSMWRDAGIRSASTRVMSLGGGVVMWGVRDGGA